MINMMVGGFLRKHRLTVSGSWAACVCGGWSGEWRDQMAATPHDWQHHVLDEALRELGGNL